MLHLLLLLCFTNEVTSDLYVSMVLRLTCLDNFMFDAYFLNVRTPTKYTKMSQSSTLHNQYTMAFALKDHPEPDYQLEIFRIRISTNCTNAGTFSHVSTIGACPTINTFCDLSFTFFNMSSFVRSTSYSYFHNPE